MRPARPITPPRPVTAPAAAQALRKRELAAIHAAAAALGMDTTDRDPTTPYRALLKAQGGHTSAAELSADGRRRVLAELARLQGKPAKPKHGWQADKIARLWRQLGDLGVLNEPGEPGLNAFVLAKTGMAAPRFLPAQQANRMIETLKAWVARELRKAGAA